MIGLALLAALLAPAPTPTQEDMDRVAAESAAAAKAAQEAETRLIELRQEFEAIESARRSLDDLRRRMEAVETRPAPRGSAEPDAAARFAVRPIVLAQMGFEGALVKEAPGKTVSDDRSSFHVRRVELGAHGHVFDPRLRYRLQVGVDGVSAAVAGAEAGRVHLQDAYVEYVNCACLTVRAGQSNVAFGTQRTTLRGRYELVDASAAVNAFDLDRDVGAWLLGRVASGRVRYEVGVSNGAGRNRWDDNVDKAYTARLGYEPLGAMDDHEGDLARSARPVVSIGAAGYYNLAVTDAVARAGDADPTRADADGDGRLDNVGVLVTAADLRAKWRGFALQSEAFWRREDPGAAAPDRRYRGFYAQVSGFVRPRVLALVARVSAAERPLYGAAKNERDLAGTRTEEYGGGVSWYLAGPAAKIQADYALVVERNVLAAPALFDRDSHRVRVQATVAF